MSTTVILASQVATTNTMLASQSAQRSRETTERCKLYVEGFDNTNPTVAEQKYFASCVQRLNPEPVSENDQLVMKGCVLLLLISLVVGIVWGWKEGDGFAGMVMGALLWPLITALFILVVFGVIAGIGFLFS